MGSRVMARPTSSFIICNSELHDGAGQVHAVPFSLHDCAGKACLGCMHPPPKFGQNICKSQLGFLALKGTPRRQHQPGSVLH